MSVNTGFYIFNINEDSYIVFYINNYFYFLKKDIDIDYIILKFNNIGKNYLSISLDDLIKDKIIYNIMYLSNDKSNYSILKETNKLLYSDKIIDYDYYKILENN